MTVPLLAPKLRPNVPEPATAVGRVVAAARAEAEAVDQDRAFPTAALEAMRRERLLSGLLPAAVGGAGLSVSALAGQCWALGTACGSAAMVFAMHQTQVASLLAHGGADPWQVTLLRRIVDEQMLVASVTSEAGVGGDFRTSHCALQWLDGRFGVEKMAPVISYGAHADCLLVTARRDGDAGPGDQVLVAATADAYTLERLGRWNGMGLRGTDSSPFKLTASGGAAQVLRDPFSVIATRTMLPLSHLLWSAIWLGTAADVITRTKRFLKQEIRRTGTPPPAGRRLVEAVGQYMVLRARTKEMLARYDTQFTDGSFGARLSDTAEINLLKISVSEGCIAVAHTCLHACGFAGFGNAGPFSLTRQLRDLEAAPLMVNNDRIADNTAHLLLAQLPALDLQPS